MDFNKKGAAVGGDGCINTKSFESQPKRNSTVLSADTTDKRCIKNESAPEPLKKI